MSATVELLRGLRGASVANTANGPVDLDSPTLDVVRAMRAGAADTTPAAAGYTVAYGMNVPGGVGRSS